MPRTEHQLASRRIVQKEKRKFAKDLAEWRAGKDYTIQQCADKFGVSRGLIQSLLEGRAFPSFELAVVVCTELGTTIPSAVQGPH